ncbi:PAAR domain-containing protein [Burkholderia ubonensis]|uniref:PAAR domain-containing protein n=2 Tax=Burkholderia ubonensis TaxID=101571 RepID=UPI000A60D52D|nr:PAAR domain-containing protein [Burkholderia ubonensis]
MRTGLSGFGNSFDKTNSRTVESIADVEGDVRSRKPPAIAPENASIDQFPIHGPESIVWALPTSFEKPAMTRRAVRDGDPTTTGGVVIAATSTIFDDDRHVALHDDEATCGNCEGRFKIFGSAERMAWHGRNVVLDGDPVLCPCGKNKVLAGSDCQIFYEDPGGEAAGISASSLRETVRPFMPLVYDEQFVIRDKRTRKPLSNVQYWIKDRSANVLASGLSDGQGCTVRVRTAGADTLKLEIGD